MSIPAPRVRAGSARARGSALVYLCSTFVALVAFASLAVDLGRVYVVRSELQLAADSAARYAVAGLGSGVATAEDYAVDAAADNSADGAPVALSRSDDIVFGTWDKRTFTPLSGSDRANANAIQVTARRTAASGGGVSLFFARVIGKTTHDVQARSIAYIEDKSPSGIIGFSSIQMKNNTFIGSYNSATDRNPTEATASAVGSLASNGTIAGGYNNDLQGGINLGPGAPNVAGIDVSGTTRWLGAPLVPPAEAAWAPGTNPNGLPLDYTATGNVTLPGGEYWFTSVSVSRGSLSFSGPAVLIVNGPITVGGRLHAYDLVPGNLVIRQIGNTVFGDEDASGMDIVADVIAPNSDFIAKNNLLFRGRMVMKSITFMNNADVYYDVALGDSTAGGRHIATVR